MALSQFAMGCKPAFWSLRKAPNIFPLAPHGATWRRMAPHIPLVKHWKLKFGVESQHQHEGSGTSLQSAWRQDDLSLDGKYQQWTIAKVRVRGQEIWTLFLYPVPTCMLLRPSVQHFKSERSDIKFSHSAAKWKSQVVVKFYSCSYAKLHGWACPNKTVPRDPTLNAIRLPNDLLGGSQVVGMLSLILTETMISMSVKSSKHQACETTLNNWSLWPGKRFSFCKFVLNVACGSRRPNMIKYACILQALGKGGQRVLFPSGS